MPVDEAALHAAIIAVNEALDHDAEDNAARALKNPAACLADINQVRLYRVSHTKQKETKQQQSMLPFPAVPGCYLVYFRFLRDIHSIHPYCSLNIVWRTSTNILISNPDI